MHRNTFINAPSCYTDAAIKHRPTVLAAGQLIGTESYTAASAGGWLAGTNAARLAGQEPLTLPATTMMVVVFHQFASPKHFQPMPPNLGFAGTRRIKTSSNDMEHRDRALADLASWMVLSGSWGRG